MSEFKGLPSRYEPLDPREYPYLREPHMTLSDATAVLGWVGHGARQDEAMLWSMLVLAGITPRAGAAVIGMPANRLVAICEKWSGAGIYDYGCSCDLGWVDWPSGPYRDARIKRLERRAQSAPKYLQDRRFGPNGA